MRVVRAILGGFARFLVRIARTLDPALATAPYWVMPERMANLRQQYPGAPEHWLEFVARRAAIGQSAEPSASPPERHAPAAEIPAPQARARSRNTLRNLLGVSRRPVVVFPRAHSSPKARADAPPIAMRMDVTAPTLPASAAPTAPPPRLTFSTKSVRNPIANLLRIRRPERRPPMLHFNNPDPVRRTEQDAPEQVAFARHEHQTVFPIRDGRSTYRSDQFGTDDAHRDAGGARAELRWPAWPGPSMVDPTWPDGRPGTPRPDPTFRTPDSRWPELPRVAIEQGAPTASSIDEAILLAEQIGGTWSG
jgi:hypothetical protein